MAQNIPATILGFMAGAGVSIAGGALLGSYVVSGVTPAEAAPPRIRPVQASVDEDTWPVQDYLAPVSGRGDPDQAASDEAASDQALGVRASGSSRL